MLQNQSVVPPIVQVLQAVVTLGVAVVAGVWAFVKVGKRREHHPRLEFNVDINFVGRQGDVWLVELLALVHNKGLVRHVIRQFTFDLRIIETEDPLIDGDDRINYQTRIPRKIKDGAWVPAEWGNTFIEPGVTTRYSFVTVIPVAASFALLHGRFDYGRRAFHTADRLVKVPGTNASPET